MSTHCFDGVEGRHALFPVRVGKRSLAPTLLDIHGDIHDGRTRVHQRVLDLLQIGRLRGAKVRGAKFKVMHLVPVDDHFGEIEQRQHRAGQVEVAAARRAEVVVETPGGNGNSFQLGGGAGGRVLLRGRGERTCYRVRVPPTQRPQRVAPGNHVATSRLPSPLARRTPDSRFRIPDAFRLLPTAHCLLPSALRGPPGSRSPHTERPGECWSGRPRGSP